MFWEFSPLIHKHHCVCQGSFHRYPWFTRFFLQRPDWVPVCLSPPSRREFYHWVLKSILFSRYKRFYFRFYLLCSLQMTKPHIISRLSKTHFLVMPVVVETVNPSSTRAKHFYLTLKCLWNKNGRARGNRTPYADNESAVLPLDDQRNIGNCIGRCQSVFLTLRSEYTQQYSALLPILF